MKTASLPVFSLTTLISVLVLMLIFTPGSLSAQEIQDQEKQAQEIQGKKAENSDLTPETLNVTSDKMVAEKNQSTVEFTGNVKVVRADSILLAQSVKVFFHPSETKEKGQSSIKRILAKGHVEYTQGEDKAYSDQADYNMVDEVLVLTGEKAKLLTGKSWITGRKITLYKSDGRVVVESAKDSRVNAFFDTQDQNRGQDRNQAKNKDQGNSQPLETP